MSITVRTLRWLLSGILCCGGCVTPALVEPAAPRTSPVEVVEAVGEDAGEDTAAQAAAFPASAHDAPPVDAASQPLGIPEEQATRLAEIFLHAYAKMNREAEAGEFAAQGAADGVQVPEAQSAAASASPASLAGQGSGTSSGTRATAHVGDGRASRPATSKYAAKSPRQADLAQAAAPPGDLPLSPAEPAADALAEPAADALETASPPAAQEPVPEVSVAAVSWSRQVKAAIEQLRRELDDENLDDEQRARDQICLSLLQLAAENPEQAVESLTDLDDQQLEFWRQTVMGMGLLLDPDELPKFRQRVESAAEHFSRGIYALSSLGPLRLLNVSLCTKVNGYGDFVECDAYALVPGKPVILYVEVENFTAERVQADPAQAGWGRSSSRRTSSSNSPRYVTELHGRYEILDVNQRTVVSRTLPVGGDECRNQRRDFYISYVLYMPENIAPGPYTLELTIEDKKGGKFGNAVVDFRIR